MWREKIYAGLRELTRASHSTSERLWNCMFGECTRSCTRKSWKKKFKWNSQFSNECRFVYLVSSRNGFVAIIRSFSSSFAIVFIWLFLFWRIFFDVQSEIKHLRSEKKMMEMFDRIYSNWPTTKLFRGILHKPILMMNNFVELFRIPISILMTTNYWIEFILWFFPYDFLYACVVWVHSIRQLHQLISPNNFSISSKPPRVHENLPFLMQKRNLFFRTLHFFPKPFRRMQIMCVHRHNFSYKFRSVFMFSCRLHFSSRFRHIRSSISRGKERIK